MDGVSPPVESTRPFKVALFARMLEAGKFVTDARTIGSVLKLKEGIAQEVPEVFTARAVKK